MPFHYTVRHEFSNGEETYEFTSPVKLDRFYGDDEQLETLAEKMGINFEPHKGEFLHVTPKCDDTIIMHLTETDVKEIMDASR